MCLVILKTDKAKVAEENIKCYKLVEQISDKYARSIIFHHDWEIDKLYEVDMVVVNNVVYRSDFFDDLATETYLKYEFSDLKMVKSGFHASLNIERNGKWSNFDNCEFIIPKGSTYYTDESGLVVSNKMIYTGICHR